MKVKPTEEQLYPVDMAKAGSSLIINAFAGTGKSTTFKFIADELKNKKILYVTFGKENIISARKKFKLNVDCYTAHSLAYRYVDSKLQLTKNKLLISSLSVGPFLEGLGQYASSADERTAFVIRATLAIGIVSEFCKSTDQKISGKHLLPNERIISSEDESESIQMAKRYWNLAMEGRAFITHDMYLKMWQVSCPSLDYDLILFDEAQDADPLMIDVITRQNAQTIAVGDDHQQIYSFRGATNALKQFNFENQSSLTKSFRYGPQVAELANAILYKYKGIKTDIKGNPALRTSVHKSNIPHDVQIGRTVQSLFKEMFEMQEGGYDDFACWADIRSIKSIILSISALRNNKPVYHPFIAGFDNYAEFKLYCDYSPNDAIPTYQAIMGEHGFRETMEMLDHLGSKKKAETIFLTAHKSKGLEFQGVTLMNDFVGPDKDKWSEEEANLLYVAATRAISNLDIGNCRLLSFFNR